MGLSEDKNTIDDEGPDAAASSSAATPSSSSTGVQRRGGIRRRIQESQETHADQPAKPLTDALKRQWAAGELSSRQVQELALTAGQQGAHSMERLGAAGKSGENPQHLQRALLSIFGRPAGAPPFTWVQVPLLINKKERLAPQPMLLPHHYFQSLFHHRHELWKATVEGVDAAGALRFWQNMRETAFVKQHPHLAEANWSATIPLGLHGDGGGFYKHESLFVFTWNSILGTGSTKSKRFVMTAVRKSQMLASTFGCIVQTVRMVVQCAPQWHLARRRLGGQTFGRGWPMVGQQMARGSGAGKGRLGIPLPDLPFTQVESWREHVLDVQGRIRRTFEIYCMRHCCSMAGDPPEP